MSLTNEDKQWINQGREEDRRWITDLLDERLERVETKLSTAFQQWALPTDARQRTRAAVLRMLRLESETSGAGS